MNLLTLSLLAALSAAPAVAQEAEPSVADEMAPMLGQLFERMRPLADSVGVGMPVLTAQFEPLIRAAVPATPPGAAGDNWAFDMSFSNRTAVTDDGSAPDGRQPVYASAQACAAAFTDGAVVHFRRIREGGLVGHQCILTFQDGEMGMLLSETYAEAPDRFVTASYRAGASVTDDPAAMRAAVDPVLEANVALAEAFADLALEAGIKAKVGD
jgi:hypothetical protein